MLAASLLSMALACCANQQQGDSTLDGVSVPLRQDLSDELSDALSYLEQQRWHEAIPILQRLVSSPDSAVHKHQNDLYVGVASFAAKQLRNLPPAASEWYRNNYQELAAAVVLQHQRPLNIEALERATLQYAGLTAEKTAQLTLYDAYVDRNYYDLCQDALDERRPYVALDNLQPAWSYKFGDVLPLRHNTHRLAFGNGLVYATNGHDVVALDSVTGSERWKFKNLAWLDINNKLNAELHAAQSRFTSLQPVLSNGVLLVNIHQAKAVGRSDKYRRIDIRHMTPLRRLHAFDAHSGELLWRQVIEADDAETNSITIGAPLVSSGRVFVPVYDASGNVDISLMCFDLHSGKQLFKTFLASGSMETNLFGNLLTEAATPAPVSDGEHVWLLSQFGTLSCVAARTGVIEWTRTYPRTKVVVRQDGGLSQRINHFANNDIFLKDGLIVVAPLDSQALFAVNGSSGELIKSYPAQDRDDNRIRFILDYDGKNIITSGSYLQKIDLDSGGKLYTSTQLYRYNGYDNENLLSSKLSTTHAWMPYENGVAAAALNDINDTYSIINWDDSPELASCPIQLDDGAVLFLTPNGIICYRSDKSYTLSVAQPSTTRRDLNYYLQVGANDLSIVKAIKRKLRSQLTEDYFAAIDRDLANLIVARCELLLGNRNSARSLLRRLSICDDRDVAWQALVLLAESTATSNPQLMSDPLRPALLLSRHTVPAAALDAKLSGDWRRLLDTYLLNDSDKLVYSWLTETLADSSKQQQLEKWLDVQLAGDDLPIDIQISIFNIAYRFSSDDYHNHAQLLDNNNSLPTVYGIAPPAKSPLPFNWVLLHAFRGEEDLLLFQSQHTLILVKDGETQYITPFDSDSRIPSLIDRCVTLTDGCAILAGRTSVYFSNDGSYRINDIGIELSAFSEPRVAGDLILHISHANDNNISQLLLIEPRSGRVIYKQQLEEKAHYRNDILVAGKHAIYVTADWLADINLTHQRPIVRVSKREASEILSEAAPDEIMFSNNMAGENELLLSFTNLRGEENTTLLSDVPFNNCIQRSFTHMQLKNGSLVAFIVEDLPNRRMVLHLALVDIAGNLMNNQSLDLHLLSTAKPQISLSGKQVIVSASNRHYTFEIK
ncbi:MAG: PQQ-binding-like beta-propeller repeat protein [Planctomycetota bacterium]|nr:PQQ-binding-like beta-propeller repeat protein [Planctomycetota bacterium]